jgi:hypothetical protein
MMVACMLRLMRHPVLLPAALLLAALHAVGAPAAAATLNFTVNTSEPVTVTGTPRIAIDVGGATRYASYAAGSGTAALTFAYAVQSGDFDANGITLTAPLDLNGGSITDTSGNPANPLTFTLPDTSALKVQTYTASFTTGPITNANANAVSFAISKAPLAADFTYAITSDGGAGSVTGSGSIGGSPHTVSGVDVSALPTGTLTLSVTVTTATGGTGAAKTATATPTFTGVLDNLPAAAAAFSIRRLSGAYTGPLLRVRRSSDNATQDIGTTISGDLDAAALASFCGSGSCFAATWYDQSGNSQNAVQAGTTSQPRIMSGGVTELEGSRPALRFTATAQWLDAGVIPGQSLQGSFNLVARCGDASATRHPIGNRDFSTARGRAVLAASGGASFAAGNVGGASVTLTGSTVAQRVITSLSASSGNMSGALDGIVTTGTTNTYFLASTVGLWIGGGGVGQSSVGNWVGTISEAMVFNVTLSTSERQTLERDQGSYYGVTVQ